MNSLLLYNKEINEENERIISYANDIYTVNIVFYEGDFDHVNIYANDFYYPSIDTNFGVNFAATGSLKALEINEFNSKLAFAKETYLQALLLKSIYVNK